MECWPDDPADIGLESVLRTVAPLFEQRVYPPGTKLARQGDPATCIYYIEEGYAKVLHTMVKDTAVDSDEEEEDEVNLIGAYLYSRHSICLTCSSTWSCDFQNHCSSFALLVLPSEKAGRASSVAPHIEGMIQAGSHGFVVYIEVKEKTTLTNPAPSFLSIGLTAYGTFCAP